MVHKEAIHIEFGHSGYCTIEQVSAIFSYLLTGDEDKKGWNYVADPRGVNNFFYANQTLMEGEEANPKRVGGGGCADFAILMSALVESIGGTTRIILAHNNTSEGHAFTEVYMGKFNDTNVNKAINRLEQQYETDKIYVNINTTTKDVWLNLDWWPDQKGNAHPGGPFFQGDKNIVLYIRENFKKSSINVPEEPNQLPKLISLDSDKDSPQDVGSIITWIAKAKDSDNDPIYYKFLLNGKQETKWVEDNIWVWNTTNDDVGKNQIEVQIRDGKYGHALVTGFDDYKSSGFNITEAKPTRPTPQKIAQIALQQEPASLKIDVYETNLNGTALPGVRVTGTDAAGNSFSGTTDSNGAVVLSGQPGTWQFSFAKEGYETRNPNYDVTKTEEVAAYLQRIAQPMPQRTTQPAPAYITPRPQSDEQFDFTVWVHDRSLNGTALSGVQVTGQDAAGNSFSGITDSDGAVALSGQPGTWQFSFAKEGYGTLNLSYNVTSTDYGDVYLQSASSADQSASAQSEVPVVSEVTPTQMYQQSSSQPAIQTMSG